MLRHAQKHLIGTIWTNAPGRRHQDGGSRKETTGQTAAAAAGWRQYGGEWRQQDGDTGRTETAGWQGKVTIKNLSGKFH